MVQNKLKIFYGGTNKMEELEIKTPDEANMRVCIKVTATKGALFEVTARGNTKEELNQRLDEIIQLAKSKCQELNQEVTP